MRCLPIYVLLIGLAVSASTARGEDLEVVARRLMDQQVTGWNAMSAEEWAADFTEDSTFVNIIGTYFTNRQQNVDRHAFLFETIFKGSTLSAEVLAVQALTDNVALVETHFFLRGHQANPPGIRNTDEGVLQTHIKFVIQKRDDAWRIVAAQNTAVAGRP